MQSNVERLDRNRVTIEIRLDPVEVDKALGEAFLRVARRVKIPGFRKGRAPRPVLEAHYGKEVFYEDAADIMIPDAYRRALDEHDLEPFDQPELTVVEPVGQGKPFVFQATVPVLPAVALGEYTGVKAEKPAPIVGEEEVGRRLAVLREQYAELVLADHEEVATGDFAVVDFDGYMDGKPFEGGSATGYTIEAGAGGHLPGFSEGLSGMRRGETREIQVQFPEDYRAENLAGQKASFAVTLREIKRKELPDLDADFAKSLGHDSIDELTARTLSSLQAAADREAERIFADRVVERVVAGAQVEIPEVLIARQTDRRYEALKSNLAHQGLEIDRYLANLGKTEDEIKREIRPQAEAEVRLDLVIDAVRKAEGIQPTEEEIEQRLKELAPLSGAKDEAEFRRALARNGRMEAVKDSLARAKTIRFLVEKAEPMAAKD